MSSAERDYWRGEIGMEPPLEPSRPPYTERQAVADRIALLVIAIVAVIMAIYGALC